MGQIQNSSLAGDGLGVGVFGQLVEVVRGVLKRAINFPVRGRRRRLWFGVAMNPSPRKFTHGYPGQARMLLYLEAQALVESVWALPFGEGPKAVTRLSCLRRYLSKSD